MPILPSGGFAYSQSELKAEFGNIEQHAKTQLDFKEFKVMMTDIKNVVKGIRDAGKNVTVQYGAYMNYSLFLETGTSKMPVGHVRSPRSAKAKGKVVIIEGKPIGPHIAKSLKDNAGDIVKTLHRLLMRNLQSVNKKTGKSITVTASGARQAYERALVAALNDKPRADAVKNAPYEFGFHRRSIRAYNKPRPVADVLAEQATVKDKGKKKAKAAKKK